MILTWTGDELLCGQARIWRTDGHTARQTQATLHEGQNWPRVKVMLTFSIQCKDYAYGFCFVMFCCGLVSVNFIHILQCYRDLTGIGTMFDCPWCRRGDSNYAVSIAPVAANQSKTIQVNIYKAVTSNHCPGTKESILKNIGKYIINISYESVQSCFHYQKHNKSHKQMARISYGIYCTLQSPAMDLLI